MIKIVIIGGGASGLMAAIQAARKGAQVTLLEQNEKIGKKILATGNGRCNLTNLHQEPSCYHCSQPDYPWRVIEQFPLTETLSFFYQLGISTRDRNGWLYPYSDQASSVAQVLEMEARYQKVRIKTREEITDIQCLGEGFTVVLQPALHRLIRPCCDLLRFKSFFRGGKCRIRLSSCTKAGTSADRTYACTGILKGKRKLFF